MGIVKNIFRNIFKLPGWARASEDGFIEMKPSVVYPLALKALDMEVSGYSLGVARRCISQLLLKEIAKEPIKIRFVNAKSKHLKDPDYKQWRIDSYPPTDEHGRTYDQGCIEWAQHYERFKKRMPRRLTSS